MDSRQQQLRERLTSLGFDDVRFASLAEPLGGGLRAWLAAGMHADMAWMERTADKRMDPQLVLPGARSAILLGVSYWSAALRRSGQPSESEAPVWARYALHEDYHDTIKPALATAGKALEQLFGASEADYRYYVDTGPVLERAWAARSGLGFVGKNAMLISRRDGNWLFLASILTRVELVSDQPIKKQFGNATPGDVGLLCGKCTRCLDSCPTDAFASAGVVDARRCISYQTIENKGIIPRELRAGIGNRIYGCDVCLEVCPWNRFAQEGRRLLLSARHDVAQLTLAEILELTPERFATIFRRTPIKRLKLVGLLRNACVVAGNVRDPNALPPLLRLASTHESPVVRAHAVWAIRRLGAAAKLADAATLENDAVVLAEYAADP